MSASGTKSLPAIGFLTVLDEPEGGLIGGLLALNANGRPLEFHCTSPVRPNRAQEILYGPTLRPYLYGEQIAQTLLGKLKVEPLVVCTDVEPVLAVRDFVTWPVAWVSAVAATSTAPAIELAGCRLHVAAGYETDGPRIVDAWRSFADKLELAEPFGRIREAIEEAQRVARAA